MPQNTPSARVVINRFDVILADNFHVNVTLLSIGATQNFTNGPNGCAENSTSGADLLTLQQFLSAGSYKSYNANQRQRE
jgi:hypothetical protein